MGICGSPSQLSSISRRGGGLIGGLGSILAFFLSYPLGWHLGATIIMVLGLIFLAAYIFAARKGA